MKRTLLTVLFGSLAVPWFLFAAVNAAMGVDPAGSPPTVILVKDPSKELAKETFMPKIGQELRRLYERHQKPAPGNQEGSGKESSLRSSPSLQISGGFVVIDAIALNDSETLQADLEAMGLRRSVRFGRVVSGLFPIAEIPKLSSLESLNFARASSAQIQGVPGTGAVQGSP